MKAGTKIILGTLVGAAAWVAVVSLREPPRLVLPPDDSPADRKMAPAPLPQSALTGGHSPEDVLDTATAEELAAAIRQRMAAGASAEEIRAALELLARRNPLKALELAMVLARTEEEKHGWVSALLGDWARRDPVAAWGWANAPTQQYAVPGDPSLSVIVLSAVAADDPARAVEIAEETLHTEDAAADVASAAVDALLRTGNAQLARDTIERWNANPDTRTKLDNASFEKAALALANESRTAAADWLRDLPASESRNLALATLAAEWSETAPQAAMQWAAALEGDEGRTDAMQRVFNRWAATDMTAASQWLAENEAHPKADELIASLVSDSPLRETNPALALRWAELIADADARSRNVESIVLGWGNQDRDAAVRHVNESTTLKPEQRQRLLEALRTGPVSGGGADG